MQAETTFRKHHKLETKSFLTVKHGQIKRNKYFVYKIIKGNAGR